MAEQLVNSPEINFFYLRGVDSSITKGKLALHDVVSYSYSQIIHIILEKVVMALIFFLKLDKSLTFIVL